MMFGHDDQQQTNDAMQPAPDATLAQPSTDMPTDNAQAAGMADTTVTPSVPADTDAHHQDDSASEYLMDDARGAGSAPAVSHMSQGDGGELMGIKQQALQQLSPLLGHLDQTPVEKFRTTMMLIQASDNKSLIPQAYEAAKAISDDKVRAQALLDVVNEINYFTQQSESEL